LGLLNQRIKLVHVVSWLQMKKGLKLESASIPRDQLAGLHLKAQAIDLLKLLNAP